ncbi:MAG TPA: phosphotransferase [Acidimicrobiales bacterium]|nr:phosphotransferase [Acidimicrobiales bacterium]
MEARPVLGLREVAEWLRAYHGEGVVGLEELPSGCWSAAFGYRVGDLELVLRVGTMPYGFEMDRLAREFARPGLPIPEVLEVGEAFGSAFAVSMRSRGRFLETIDTSDAAAARPAVLSLLGALREVPAEPRARASWFGDGGATTWRDWLTASLVDDPNLKVNGWRASIASDRALEDLYRACEHRVTDQLDACPERRDLVHGDLLNRNVLVAEDASEIERVYSWKCSVRGDVLYDVAWCTFWSPWHAGIDALDLWSAVKNESWVGAHAAARHHCYLLHIGLRNLASLTWSGKNDERDEVAARTASLLDAN